MPVFIFRIIKTAAKSQMADCCHYTSAAIPVLLFYLNYYTTIPPGITYLLSIAAFFISGSRMPYYTIRNEISGISAADFVGGRFISVSQRTGYAVMGNSSCICSFKNRFCHPV